MAEAAGKTTVSPARMPVLARVTRRAVVVASYTLSAAVPVNASSQMTVTGFAPGGSGQDVIVQVGYSRALFFPIVRSVLGQNGTLLVYSSLAFQNEPY